MKPRAVVLLASLAAPLRAQTSIETGGGVARLDHYSGGAFSTFRGQLNGSFRDWQLSLNSVTTEHRGLGTTNHTDVALRRATPFGSWYFSIGPTVHLGRDVEMPSTQTIGGEASLYRNFSGLRTSVSHERGVAWFGDNLSDWHRSQLNLEQRIGPLRVGTSLAQLSLTEQVMRTDIVLDHLTIDTSFHSQQRQLRELNATIGFNLGRFSFDGRVGGQFTAKSEVKQSWEGNLAVRVGSALSIIVGHSKLAPDPLLRLQGGNYTSLGLRLGQPQGKSPAQRSVSSDPLAVEVAQSGPSTYKLRFAIPGARRTASLSGDVTAWKPVELTRLDDGRWEVEVQTLPGIFRINIRADEGEWAVPPGFLSRDDGFGGRVGLLVVRP